MIYILFISLALASSIGCFAEESGSASAPNALIPQVPKEGLPEGFSLLASLPEMDESVNMTEYIEDFYGDLDIGAANVTVGIYQWGNPGDSYDAKVTLIGLSDEGHALAALSNFKSQYDEMLERGVPVFENATVNGHDALEIKDLRGDNSIRYLYLWNRAGLVALVEGNSDQNQSLELAVATGL